MDQKVHRFTSIEGSPPLVHDLPPGCAFAPRCPQAKDICRQEYPPETSLNQGHSVGLLAACKGRPWIPPCWEARHVRKYFPVTKGLIFGGNVGWVHAVEDISFRIDSGETLGLVGESGCGKSTTAKLVLLLEQPTSGDILYQGISLQQMSGTDLRHYRSTVQAVFQDPQSSLNPRMRVGDIVGEPLEVNSKLPRAAVRERVAEVLKDVNLDGAFARLYPHEFSGGQRQRIALARALVTHSRLIGSGRAGGLSRRLHPKPDHQPPEGPPGRARSELSAHHP